MARDQTLSQFSKRLANAIKNLPENVNSVKKEVTLAVHSTLVDSTPVRTGQARTNWRVYTSADEGAEIPAPEDIAAGMAAAKAQANSVVNTVPRDIPLYIVNRAQHIERLNQGWSVQAPSEFVRIAALRAVQTIAKRRKGIVEFD